MGFPRVISPYLVGSYFTPVVTGVRRGPSWLAQLLPSHANLTPPEVPIIDHYKIRKDLLLNQLF